MDVKLNDDAMSVVIQKAILDSLTPERREALISAAVADLMAQPYGSGHYNERRSKLQTAFDNSVQSVAYDVAKTALTESDDFRAKVKKLFEDVSAKLFDGEQYQSLTDSMARTISNNMTKSY